jgi:hypothetical protein
MPRRGCELRFAATQTRQPTRAFTLDQRLERFPDESRLLLQASESLRFGQKFVIEGKGRPHDIILSQHGHDNSIV